MAFYVCLVRSQYDSARKASKVEVEVIIISDDDEKQPAGPKKKRRKKPSYFNKFTTFEQAKRFFEEFMENVGNLLSFSFSFLVFSIVFA